MNAVAEKIIMIIVEIYLVITSIMNNNSI